MVNVNHPLVVKISEDLQSQEGGKLMENSTERDRLKEEISFMEKEHGKKKPDEISQFEKDDLEKLRKELETIESVKERNP